MLQMTRNRKSLDLKELNIDRYLKRIDGKNQLLSSLGLPLGQAEARHVESKAGCGGRPKDRFSGFRGVPIGP